MENYSYSSYSDSRDSSPRFREIDCENQAWEEPPSNYKVKFMCSYGGKIQPRNHDNQLAYIGGETKILTVDRTIKFTAIKSKLSSICSDADVCFKYQLPGEDLDALISVTNDEDLEHMMLEYERLLRSSAKPSKLRLFLFPLKPSPTAFSNSDQKSERQWFVDALNSVQIEGSSPPAAAAEENPDFLFGLDNKGFQAVPAEKSLDSTPSPTVPNVVTKDVSAGTDCGSEDRHLVGEPVMSLAEIQRQINELQRLQIAANQDMYQRKSDEVNTRAYAGDYYTQKVPENIAPAPSPPIPVQMPIPAAYLPERHIATGGYPVAAASGGATGAEHQVYFIQTPGGVYQAVRPVTGPVSQAVNQPYYGVQRMVPEAYREQPIYNPVPQQQHVAYNESNVKVVQQPNVGVAEAGYMQVGYDSTGRQVYYTAQGGGVASYQTMAPVAVDGRQGGGGGLNQEGKLVTKPSPASAM